MLWNQTEVMVAQHCECALSVNSAACELNVNKAVFKKEKNEHIAGIFISEMPAIQVEGRVFAVSGGADRQTAPSYHVQTLELASVLRPDPPLSGCDLSPFQGKRFIISKENEKSPGCLFTDLYECNGVGCVEIVRRRRFISVPKERYSWCIFSKIKK